MGAIGEKIRELDQKQVLEALTRSIRRAQEGDDELRRAFKQLDFDVDRFRGEATEDTLNRLIKNGTRSEDVEGEPLARTILGDLDELR